ncbi:fumarate hydratase subunit beta [Desulfovibrionales bacterium]
MAIIKLTTPLMTEAVSQLCIGDHVLLSGIIYTARDVAHKRLIAALNTGEMPPFPLEGAVIYYVSPSPAPKDKPIGAAGPTTSSRMDSYTPRLHALGVKATIGKGKRSALVRQALIEYQAVYLGATGGTGALFSKYIMAARIISYEDLGPEAIRELVVKDFPLLVINNTHGDELYAIPQLPKK